MDFLNSEANRTSGRVKAVPILPGFKNQKITNMGLDVRVYQNIKEVADADDADFTAFVVAEEWEWKIKNLKKEAHYVGTCVDHTISYPYSRHSRFREMLIRLIGRIDLLQADGQINWDELPTEQGSDIPFIDLVFFADNEGCLDWEVSEKIYQDFKKWEDKVDADGGLSEYDVELYRDWMNVFDLARQNGVVVFG